MAKVSFDHVTPEMMDKVFEILGRHIEERESEQRAVGGCGIIPQDRDSQETDDNIVLTIREAANLCRVHRSVLDSLIKLNAIPHARFSERVVRFHRAELLQWIKRGGLKRE